MCKTIYQICCSLQCVIFSVTNSSYYKKGRGCALALDLAQISDMLAFGRVKMGYILYKIENAQNFLILILISYLCDPGMTCLDDPDPTLSSSRGNWPIS